MPNHNIKNSLKSNEKNVSYLKDIEQLNDTVFQQKNKISSLEKTHQDANALISKIKKDHAAVLKEKLECERNLENSKQKYERELFQANKHLENISTQCEKQIMEYQNLVKNTKKLVSSDMRKKNDSLLTKNHRLNLELKS